MENVLKSNLKRLMDEKKELNKQIKTLKRVLHSVSNPDLDSDDGLVLDIVKTETPLMEHFDKDGYRYIFELVKVEEISDASTDNSGSE